MMDTAADNPHATLENRGSLRYAGTLYKGGIVFPEQLEDTREQFSTNNPMRIPSSRNSKYVSHAFSF